jgi:hypothetical protein
VRPFYGIQDPPNHIPAVVNFPLLQNFLDHPSSISFIGCRDAIALLIYHRPLLEEAILWDPVTGAHLLVAFPTWLVDGEGEAIIVKSAAVRFSAGCNQHVEGKLPVQTIPSGVGRQ